MNLARTLILLYFFIIFSCGHVAYGTLVLRLEMEAMPPSVEVYSLNLWTARKVPTLILILHSTC